MRLKNNSAHEWLQYDCGNVKIDILPYSEFETDDLSAMVILRNLGCPQWVVKLSDTILIDYSGLPNNLKIMGCEVCGSKGWRHKKGCTKT